MEGKPEPAQVHHPISDDRMVPTVQQPGQCNHGTTQSDTTHISDDFTYPRAPVAMTCPLCAAYVRTTVTLEIGSATWGTACCLLCFCGLIGCPFAFCMDSTKDVVHTCPNCDKELGVSKGKVC